MHLVQTMAYVGQQPWHGLGNQLAPHQPLEVWAKQAGMNWSIESGDIRYVTSDDGLPVVHAYPDQRVLYRSDTKAPLSVVSKRFHVVQPREILEFYRDLTEAGGFELETAGVLKEGRKFWALAKTGQTVNLKGRDRVKQVKIDDAAMDSILLTHAIEPSLLRADDFHGFYAARKLALLALIGRAMGKTVQQVEAESISAAPGEDEIQEQEEGTRHNAC